MRLEGSKRPYASQCDWKGHSDQHTNTSANATSRLLASLLLPMLVSSRRPPPASLWACGCPHCRPILRSDACFRPPATPSAPRRPMGAGGRFEMALYEKSGAFPNTKAGALCNAPLIARLKLAPPCGPPGGEDCHSRRRRGSSTFSLSRTGWAPLKWVACIRPWGCVVRIRCGQPQRHPDHAT